MKRVSIEEYDELLLEDLEYCINFMLRDYDTFDFINLEKFFDEGVLYYNAVVVFSKEV